MSSCDTTNMATRKEQIICCVFLAYCAHVLADIADNLILSNANILRHEMRQDLKSSLSHGIKKRSLRHQIVKRDASDSVCQTQEQTFLEKLGSGENFVNKYTFENETKYSIALAWVGENEGRIMLTTTEEFLIFAKPSDLYLSTDDGHSFTNINSRINSATIRKDNGMQKHPVNSEKVYIVTHADNADGKSVLYVTEDGGETFDQVQVPFLLDGLIDFHPLNQNYLMVKTTMDRMLYVSKDGGKQWQKVLDRVRTCKWGAGNSDIEGTIYCTIDTGDVIDSGWYDMETNNYELKKSENMGSSWSKLRENVYSFGSEGDFLYTSVHSAGNDENRLMLVSTDGGKTFNEAQLPTITPDRFYSILDMTEGLIFMHVDSPGDTGHGTLFTSDSTGIIFSESLQKHLYPNFRDLTDFYKVKSMRGVYIASQLGGDNSIHTVITFDRGGEWKPIKRPEGVPCKDETKECYLQIHNAYSVSRGVQGEPPLTHENAPGLIIVHGHVADALQTTPTDVFVSSDGGYSWIKALDGPHHMQIADQGGLLVAIPSDTETPNIVKFSTDEGRCWHTYKFTDEKLEFTGVLTEPGNMAMSVGIWGFGVDDRVWRVFTIDFSKVIDRNCDRTDYDEWIPHGDSSTDPQYSGCLLGLKEKFLRLKKDSWCSNDRQLKEQKTQDVCLCTKDDYECDYGYHRLIGSDTCVKDLEFKGNYLDICLHGHKEEIVTVGYRKIPGDSCSEGFKPEGDELVDMKKKCKDGDKTIIENEIKSEFLKNLIHRSSSNGNRAVFVSIILTTLLLAVIMLAYFVRKYNLLKRSGASLRYSILTQNERYDGDNDFESALANTSIYEDSSDEETVTVEGPNKAALKSTSSGLPQNMNGPHPKVKSYHDDSDDDMLE